MFASKAGADTNPDWYHNLVAHPEVTIEVGAETKAVTARVAAGDERETIWAKQKDGHAGLRRVRGEDRPCHPGRRPRRPLTSFR